MPTSDTRSTADLFASLDKYASNNLAQLNQGWDLRGGSGVEVDIIISSPKYCCSCESSLTWLGIWAKTSAWCWFTKTMTFNGGKLILCPTTCLIISVLTSEKDTQIKNHEPVQQGSVLANEEVLLTVLGHPTLSQTNQLVPIESSLTLQWSKGNPENAISLVSYVEQQYSDQYIVEAMHSL